jgi:Tfp pilus assembly protein PilP
MKTLALALVLLASAAAAQSDRNAKNFFKDKTKIDNPFNLRDPFKSPVIKGEGKRQGRGFQVTGKGQYSNISETPLEQLNINTLRVVGVLIGKERRAMVTAGEKGKVIILKEGMKIGAEGTELKAILPGGVVLVERIVNVYGEEEFLETVVPISK